MQPVLHAMKTPRAVLLFVSLFLPAFAFAAPQKIGLLLKAHNTFWKAVETGARDAAKERGVELIVKAPMNNGIRPDRAYWMTP